MQLELEQLIWQAVQRLPPQCGRIFQMNRFEGKKNNQIAQELGLSIRTVETQISKALTLLREALADYLPVLLLLAQLISYKKAEVNTCGDGLNCLTPKQWVCLLQFPPISIN